MADLKVFWGFNAHELKMESTGYFANTLFELQENQGAENNIRTLEKIENGMFKAVDSPILYNFFALVEEPEVKTDLQKIAEALMEDYSWMEEELAEEIAKEFTERDVVSINVDGSVSLPDTDTFNSHEEYARDYFENNFSSNGGVEDYIDFDAWGEHLYDNSEGYVEMFTDSTGRIWGIK